VTGSGESHIPGRVQCSGAKEAMYILKATVEQEGAEARRGLH
jgi:hypothetical protein